MKRANSNANSLIIYKSCKFLDSFELDPQFIIVKKGFNSRSLSFNKGWKMIRAQNMGSGGKNIFGDLIT